MDRIVRRGRPTRLPMTRRWSSDVSLTWHGIPFLDTGVGLSKDADGIAGQIRITTSTPGRSDHITRDRLVSYFAGEDAEYDTNLQVDEINALTANLAITRYKKIFTFYSDIEEERHTVFVVTPATCTTGTALSRVRIPGRAVVSVLKENPRHGKTTIYPG